MASATGTARRSVERTVRSWSVTLRRTVKEFQSHDLTDWAAALTYYGVLSMFPALLVLVSGISVVGAGATQALLDELSTATPGLAQEVVTSAVSQLQADRGGASVLLAIGLLGAVWSASAYVGAFMRASNAIYDMPEGRPFLTVTRVRLTITVVIGVLLVAISVLLVFTGEVAREVGGWIGLGESFLNLWGVAQRPVLLLLVSGVLAILYHSAPNVRRAGGLRWITPGSVVAVGVWAVASAAFALYVTNFSSYNATYGALGGAIAFLTWLWVTNLAVLFGAQLNAQIERERLEAGGATVCEPFVEPRDTRKMTDAQVARIEQGRAACR